MYDLSGPLRVSFFHFFYKEVVKNERKIALSAWINCLASNQEYVFLEGC